MNFSVLNSYNLTFLIEEALIIDDNTSEQGNPPYFFFGNLLHDYIILNLLFFTLPRQSINAPLDLNPPNFNSQYPITKISQILCINFHLPPLNATTIKNPRDVLRLTTKRLHSPSVPQKSRPSTFESRTPLSFAYFLLPRCGSCHRRDKIRKSREYTSIASYFPWLVARGSPVKRANGARLAPVRRLEDDWWHRSCRGAHIHDQHTRASSSAEIYRPLRVVDSITLATAPSPSRASRLHENKDLSGQRGESWSEAGWYNGITTELQDKTEIICFHGRAAVSFCRFRANYRATLVLMAAGMGGRATANGGVPGSKEI